MRNFGECNVGFNLVFFHSCVLASGLFFVFEVMLGLYDIFSFLLHAVYEMFWRFMLHVTSRNMFGLIDWECGLGLLRYHRVLFSKDCLFCVVLLKYRFFFSLYCETMLINN